MSAEVSIGEPFKGCSSLTNPEELKHRIAVLERGECMFIDKTRHAEAAGAVGVIIIDNNEGSSSDTQPIFAMSNDDGASDDVKIAAVLLFSEEGRILKNAIAALADTNQRLTVRLAAKATGTSAKKEAEAAGQQEPSSKEESQSSQDSSGSEEIPPSADDNTNTQSTDDNTDTHSDTVDQNEGLLDKQQHTQSPNNGEENSASTTSSENLDDTEDTPRDTVSVGKNEVFCAATGAPCTATGTPPKEASSEHGNQHSADSAESPSSDTEVPQMDEPHTDSSHAKPHSEATRTENSISSQSTNDPSLSNENTQSVKHNNDEAVKEKHYEDRT